MARNPKIYSTTVTLTAADIAGLNNYPGFTLVPLPAGKVSFVESASCVLKYNDAPAIGGAASVSHFYGDAANGRNATTTAILPTFPSVDTVAFCLGKVVANTIPHQVGDVVLYADSDLGISGAIASADVNLGGSDFAVNDTFTVDGPPLSPGVIAEGIVDSVDGGGAILTFHLTNNGAGYLVNSATITATSGIGTGAAIDILTLDYSVNPMTLTVSTNYSVMDV